MKYSACQSIIYSYVRRGGNFKVYLEKLYLLKDNLVDFYLYMYSACSVSGLACQYYVNGFICNSYFFPFRV